MKKFKNNEMYLPVTAKQFEDLTNELLLVANEVSAPESFSADYFAQILMSQIHSMKHDFGYVKKSALFEGCINRISCHLTYNIVQDLQAKLKAAAGEKPDANTASTEAPGLTESDSPLSVVPDAKETG